MTTEELRISAIAFDPVTHIYTDGTGNHPIGVTGLLKKHGLSPDYSAIPQAVLDAAAARGTTIHNAIEDYENNLYSESVATEMENECVRRWQGFKLLNYDSRKVIACEYLVSDPDNIAASKIDLVFSDGTLADIKTTRTVYKKSVSWQLSLYAYMFERMNDVKVPALQCIHYNPATGFDLIPIERIPDEEVERLLDCEKNGIIYTPPVNEEAETAKEEAIAIVERNDLPTVIAQIAQMEDVLKDLKAQRDAVYSTLYQRMSEGQLSKIEGDGFTITRKAPYERMSIDTTALKADMPEVAEKYSKTTTVQGSVTIKVK